MKNTKRSFVKSAATLAGASVKAIAFIVALSLILSSNHTYAQNKPSDEKGNKQAMASTPKELIEIVENASFLEPEKYDSLLNNTRARYQTPLKLPVIPQVLDEKTDPRNDIKADDIEADAMQMVKFAQKSKDDGNILWGRIQGTKYELMAHQWIRDELKRIGLKDVHYNEMHCQYPQWTPSKIELEINYDISGKKGKYVIDEALTAFISGTTSDAGVTGDVIYVGEGTAAELKGRDLTDKIVLLKARPTPGALFNSARTAFSRLATGQWGMPRGVIVWWQIPFAKQVAGRVGALGGADELGEAFPWTSIGYNYGLYLRKLLDRNTGHDSVTARLVIQGKVEPAESRTTANTYAILPGQVDQYIVIPTHVDSYFYGLHDNAGCIALNLALARHYYSLPLSKRKYGIIFLFQGDHEVPGVGGTVPFIKNNMNMMKNNLLLVLRPEHFGMSQILDEAVYVSKTNINSPLMLLVTNLNKKLIGIWKKAVTNYSIPVGDFVYQDPAADEAAFHIPYNDIGAVSTGLIQTGILYHSTADIDMGGVNFHSLEKVARCYAYVIDEVSKLSKADIHKAEAPDPTTSIYSSDLVKVLMGDN